MNNQAAQTMPELPDPFDTVVWGEFSQHQTPVYSAGQVHQYARDYAASIAQTAWGAEPTLEMLNGGWRELERQGVDPELVEMRAVYDAMRAAAPAASGVHPDALPDGTLSKSTVKRVTALAVASVSERAREAWEDFVGCHLGDDEGEASLQTSGLCRMAFDAGMRASSEPSIEDAIVALVSALQRGKGWMRDYADAIVRDAIDRRGLDEQALTQQRGEASYDAGMAMHWIERYAAGIDEECQLDRIAEAFTTPQPSADAVREVIGSMRNFADVADKCELTEGNAQVAIRAWATQLESLLSGGSHA